MAAIFDRVTVYPSFAGSNLVEWAVNPLYVAQYPLPSGTTFTLQRANSSSGPWTDITTVPDTAATAEDTTLVRVSAMSRWYYRVRMNLGGDTNNAVYSFAEPSLGAMNRKSWLLAREIRRKEKLRLRSTSAGVAGALLQRLRWGTKTSDYAIRDFATDAVIDPQASSTYGTKYDTGYHTPITYMVDMRASSTSGALRQSDAGTVARDTVEARALAYPVPQVNDVWVCCGTGRRYNIKNVTPATSIQGIPIILNLLLEVIPPSDIVYTYTVDESVWIESCG